MSDQSMHVEDSDDASLMERGLKICVEYGSEGLRREILEDESTWLIEVRLKQMERLSCDQGN